MQITGAGGAAHRANGDEGMLARSRSRRASGRTRNQKHTLFPAERNVSLLLASVSSASMVASARKEQKEESIGCYGRR